VGKTATPEFGLPPYTEPAGRPPAVTPWDTTRLAGGSSGGAAAAVAGGLIPFAHATDGGGSIRIPAACCGLVGLKTSRGLVSRGPVGGDPLGMSVSGPLARTVTDAAALLDALAVPVPGEPYPLLTRPDSYLDAVARPPARLRIGRYATPPVPGVAVDPACLDAYESTSTLLAELGHEVVEFEPGIDAGFLPVFEVLWAVLAHGHPVPPEAEPLLAPLTRWWRDRGSAISGPEYMAATQAAIGVTRRVVAAQSTVDAVLTPMLAQLPRPVGWFTAGGDPAQDFERQKAFTPFTATYNITGQPALSLPVGWGVDGDSPELPVSVQLVGRAGDDALLLALGAQIHAALGRSGDNDRRPPTW
jgi:amidase